MPWVLSHRHGRARCSGPGTQLFLRGPTPTLVSLQQGYKANTSSTCQIKEDTSQGTYCSASRFTFHSGGNANSLGSHLIRYSGVLWLLRSLLDLDLVLQYRLPCGSGENCLWLGWLESLTIFRAIFTPPGIEVLGGRKLGPSDVLGRSHYPL